MDFLGKQPSSGPVKIAPNKEQAKELNIKKKLKNEKYFHLFRQYLECWFSWYVFSKYAWVVPDKCGYSDYGIGFDARSQFLWQTVAGVSWGSWGFLIVPLHMPIKKTIY